MTYTETLNWLFAQLPMYQREGQAAYRKDLHNIKLLSNHLNHPEQHFKSIHIGGTNGKGSCSHMLASILQESGYKVGLYTSPHLKDFRERIRINGQMISKESVVDFINQHQVFFEQNNLSFFEMTVGLAFQYFAEQNVDIAIVEVGMGGRLDATNIINPELSVITNIGLDHTKFLGDTLSKIAREKAGIIKPKTPVVIGEKHPETEPVFRQVAQDNSSKIYFAEDENFEFFETDLNGLYQRKNQQTVLQAVEILKTKNWKISNKAITTGLSQVVKNTGFQGRWQILSQHPLCIADTAHNLEGIKYVVKQLQTLSYKNLHMVMGFVNDKDVKSLLKLLPQEAKYYFSAPNIPRAKSVEDLKLELEHLSIKKQFFWSLKEAFEVAKSQAQPKDVIFVGGSIFTVAELLPEE
ncbi:bifunctional folylpolyglutamate synthase/dihydrofolate synthase [Mesohalobacter halotolerans]|uniref:Dihydrofolate synthase/folylpolyglutamate synthase n=1 Tax=Mesohalobacter halotolerans TaxID=1883405 RepID=A0A4U5TUF6_9FLAO|nr:folylpolyglutamate synthase/dihydrofolate synthase family protein [Mesohalobacter halotolerans]MBS3738866.1 bifunctional folylpolyglutamate synthase/dihydrofolate synthase [Psychroflexus sp.]TKS57144.1 bifunctional folylpolyglutamate synthase/dihydrofolate synthase [Mesohalobacter halotolerans]